MIRIQLDCSLRAMGARAMDGCESATQVVGLFDFDSFYIHILSQTFNYLLGLLY